MLLHTVAAELCAFLFAVTFWPCQLSFCLCLCCPFFLAFFLCFVPISRQLGVNVFLNKIFFMFCFTTWLSDEWIMNLKGHGWKRLCPNVVICCAGRAGRVRHYEGQHAWTWARWQRSWYSGEICSFQLTVVQRSGSVSIVLFIHLTTLCTC